MEGTHIRSFAVRPMRRTIAIAVYEHLPFRRQLEPN